MARERGGAVAEAQATTPRVNPVQERYWVGLVERQSRRPRLGPGGEEVYLMIEHTSLAGIDLSYETHEVKFSRELNQDIKAPRLGRVLALTPGQVEAIKRAARNRFVRGGASPSIYQRGAKHAGPVPVDDDVPLHDLVYVVPVTAGLDMTVIPEPIGAE